MNDNLNKPINSSEKIKLVFLLNSCKRVGPVQGMLHILSHIDLNVFEPYLITIYKENETSRLNEFLPYVKKYFFVETSKIQILTNQTQRLRKILSDISPDVIHTLGVFSDYAVSKMKKYQKNHLITSRNYVYDDYPMAFGKLKGFLLAKMHLYAMNHSKTVTCSKSLAELYKEKLNLSFEYIQNGVDTEIYCPGEFESKEKIRAKLNISKNAFVYVYTGFLLKRKNIPFMIKGFLENFKQENVILLLVGGGGQYDELKEKYKNYKNIIFTGNVSNVIHYLWAADAFISTSISEGLPNSVLEAISVGLPVLLSDIPQHKEIVCEEENIGFLYEKDNFDDFKSKMKLMLQCDTAVMGVSARKCAENVFSSEAVSYNYQQVYKKIAKNKNL